jgi:hypothetical protein
MKFMIVVQKLFDKKVKIITINRGNWLIKSIRNVKTEVSLLITNLRIRRRYKSGNDVRI